MGRPGCASCCLLSVRGEQKYGRMRGKQDVLMFDEETTWHQGVRGRYEGRKEGLRW